MAVRTISTRLAIEGDAESKQKVAALNAEFKNQQSALKLVESEYKNAANSAAALTAKGEALGKMYSTQQQKITELKSALENAQKAQQTYASKTEDIKSKIAAVEKEMADLANSTGDTSARQAELKEQLAKLNEELSTNEAKSAAAQKGVNYWGKELNNAKVDINNLNGEITKNSAYLQEAKASTDGCATSIDKFGNVTEEGRKKAGEFGKTSSAAINTLSAAIAGAGLIRAFNEIEEAITACANASIEFESAVTGVYKTVNGTDEQLAAIAKGIKDMSLEIPATTTEIAGIAEAAGQLGIQTNNVLAFSRVMADLGETTNLSATDGAKALAQFANVTQMNQGDFDRLGSTIVALGNNMATTEADIVSLGQRLAGSGKQIGLTEAQIMGFAAALSSVGIESEAGGTAFSRVFSEMQVAVETNKESLEDFAKVAGMTAEQFKTSFRQDAAGAITAFIEGLSHMSEAGISSIAALDDMGITQLRLRDSLLRTSNAGDLVRRSIELASTAWRENTALTREAELRYGTTESKLQLLKNAAEGTERAIGDTLNPALLKIADAGEEGFEWATDFVEQNPWLVKGMTAVTIGLGVLAGAIIATAAAAELAEAATTLWNLSLMANPAAAVITSVVALGAAIAAYSMLTDDANASTRELIDNINDAKTAYDESVSSIEENSAGTSMLAENVAQLASKENKTAGEKKTLIGLIDELNQKMPELSLQYDKQTDSINLTADAIRAAAKAQAEAAKQQRMIERLSELYVEQGNISEELKKKKQDLAKAEAVLASMNEDGALAVVNYGTAYDDAQAAVAAAREAVEDLEQAQQDNTSAVVDASLAIDGYAEASETTADTAQSTAESIAASMAELEEAYQVAYDAAYNNINQTIGLWDEMDNKAKTSADTLNEALESQITYMDNYVSNLEDLAGRNVEGVDTLVSRLSDGSAESAAALAGLADASDEEIARLVENLGKVDEGKENFATVVASMQTDFDTKAAEIEQRMTDMVAEFDQSEDAYDKGQATMQGIIDGLNSKIASLRAKVNEINRLLAQIGSSSGSSRPKTDGSHADGLVYVPYDGYIAELHQGERVLDADEAKAYMEDSIPRSIDVRIAGASGGSATKNIKIDARSTIISPEPLSEAEITRENEKNLRWILGGGTI